MYRELLSEPFTRRFKRLLVLLGSLVLISCGGSGKERNFLFLVDAEAAKPFIWFFSDFDNTEAGFDDQLVYGDPFRATTLLIQDWIKRRDAATTVARVEKMIAKWRLDEPDGKLTYTFAYGRLPAGWWSGMDSWSFPMLLLSLWQDTNDPRLKAIADRLIATASRDVLEGGVVWRNGDECWFSEYAWDSMQVADEFYVLNGHLYALQAIRMMASATKSAELQSLYECGLRGTKTRAAQFAIGDQWLLYMLEPKTINQTHYVIYESMQFDALARLDADPFFADEAAKRRSLLARYFPVRIRSTPTGPRLFLSAIGAPHPYSIDTYPLAVRCTDGTLQEDHVIADPTNPAIPLSDRAFLDVPTRLDPESATCRVESRYVGLAHKLYEGPTLWTQEPASAGVTVGTTLEAILDARLLDSSAVEIDPARRATVPPAPLSYLDTQGRLIFTPDVPVPLGDEEFVGIEFGATGALRIGLTIVSEGVDYFRYYPRTLQSDKTVVLLSPVGFDGGQAIRNIERLTMFVYTDQQTVPVELRNLRLVKFKGQADLYEYFRQESPEFHTE